MNTVVEVCAEFRRPVRLQFWTPAPRVLVDTTNAGVIDALLRLESKSNWQGYDLGGWIIAPDDTLVSINCFVEGEAVASQAVIVYTSTARPDVVLPMYFANLEPFADANGQYMGTHPCYAGIMDKTVFDAWLKEARG